MQIVKVKYLTDTSQLSERDYSYFTEEPLKIGDTVMVPVKNTTGRAMVTAIDIPPVEVTALNNGFRLKTITAGSKISIPVDPTPLASANPVSAEVVAEVAAVVKFDRRG